MSLAKKKKAKAVQEQGNINVYFLLQYIVFLMKIIRDSSVSYALRR